MDARIFKNGERVILRSSKRRRRMGARVVGIERGKRRIITDLGERKTVPIRALDYPQHETILMLEARLDRNLNSKREQGRYIKALLEQYGAKLLYERVHTIEGLQFFLRSEGRKSNVRLIHFTGHGHGREGTLSLTLEDIKLAESSELFKGLKGKILLFSSCEIGRRAKILRNIVRENGLAGIITYRAEVEDTYANLAESMVYDRLLLSSDPPERIVKHVNAALKALGAKPELHPYCRNVLCCYN